MTTQTATISSNDIKAGRLPESVTGVYWADALWTECRIHLLDPSWSAQVSGTDEATGVALFGPVECDACHERDEA